MKTSMMISVGRVKTGHLEDLICSSTSFLSDRKAGGERCSWHRDSEGETST